MLTDSSLPVCRVQELGQAESPLPCLLTAACLCVGCRILAKRAKLHSNMNCSHRLLNMSKQWLSNLPSTLPCRAERTLAAQAKKGVTSARSLTCSAEQLQLPG